MNVERHGTASLGSRAVVEGLQEIRIIAESLPSDSLHRLSLLQSLAKSGNGLQIMMQAITADAQEQIDRLENA